MSFSTTAVLGQFAAQHGLHGEKARLIVGEEVLENLDVIPGKSQAETIDQTTLLATNVDLQDFQVRTSDLVLPSTGQQFIPDHGMVIEVTRGEVVQRFRVTHPNPNESPYQRADAYGAVLRVHTIEMERPTPASEGESGGGGEGG